MIRLTEAISAWGSPEFGNILKREMERLDVKQLHLQQGLSEGSYALDNEFQVMIIHCTEESETIRVKAGIFFNGLVAGCSCADDPTPENETTEYCEVQLLINKVTGQTSVTILS